MQNARVGLLSEQIPMILGLGSLHSWRSLRDYNNGTHVQSPGLVNGRFDSFRTGVNLADFIAVLFLPLHVLV